MSQVISVRVPASFAEACAEFRNQAEIIHTDDSECSVHKDFMVCYDHAVREIRCEGNLPDLVYSALETIKERYGGTLFYEGEELNAEDEQNVAEATSMGKIWIILMIIFFPISLIYLVLRTFVWLPYRIWKDTR